MADKKIPPLRIVLSGGGIRAVAHSGALKKLEEDGMLTAVKEYIGVSAGALIAFCITIGYKIPNLANLCNKFDFSTIRSLEPEDLFSFFETYGMDSGTKLQRLLESLLRQRGLPTTLTFKQLRESIPTAPMLRVFATDLCAVKQKEFSEKKTPGVTLVTALMASMCIPGYFVPIKDSETGHFLVDGGALHNFPFAFLTDAEQEAALGITFSEDHVKVEKIDSVYQYFQQIYACFYLPRTLDIWNKNKDKIIIIPCGDYPLWDFEASAEAKERLIRLGYEAAACFLKGSAKPLLKRRYSVS
jgi:NTE family protein